MKISNILLIATLLFALSPKPSFAAPNTDFSACLNPQGTLIADYANGTHGIVNNTGVYTGSDKVYKLSNGNAMQCFCGTNNEGIQTNWLKNTGFSEAEIAVLKSQGWTSIPDGSVWGLDQGQYFAQNSSFSCNGGSNGSSNGSSNSSNNGSSSNSDPKNSTQAILGASTTAISSLANTGNTLLFYSTFILGTTLTIIGLVTPTKKRKSSSQ